MCHAWQEGCYRIGFIKSHLICVVVAKLSLLKVIQTELVLIKLKREYGLYVDPMIPTRMSSSFPVDYSL